jgi:ADP-ribose pyrophosphatase YjhB (NUDIX family)
MRKADTLIMSIEIKTRKEVNRRVRRLREEYGEFPVHEETVTNEPDFFEHGREMAREGWIGDAGAWVTDSDDRVLLIRHQGAPDQWGTPGGGHEPKETMEETARREVREETGIECSITDVFWARRKTIVLEPDPDQRLFMLTVEFEAEYERGEITIGDEDIVKAKWFSEAPESVHDFLDEQVEEWNDR